jgi:VWFA-related protein
MKSRISILLVFFLTVSPQLPLFGQTPTRSNQQREQTVRVSTAEVTLDVVVRDKKGRPVRDLAVTDFEVYEDGARQKIESFRLVGREKNSGNDTAKKEGAAPKPVAPTPPARGNTAETNVVALVFDRLRPEARMLARRAGLAYAAESIVPGDFTGVFLIDQSLQILQPFTDQAQLASQAVEQATTLMPSVFASNTEQIRSASGRSAALEQSGAASASSAGSAGAARDSAGASAAGQDAGLAGVEATFAQMNTRILETFETLDRNQQGYATVYALLAVIESLRNLPGRKTIIFFSEGLAIPPAVQHRFRSVIHAANRANVSIYPIDAAGLRTESVDLEAAREINAIAAQRTRQQSSSRDSSSGPLMRSLERNEDLLKLNPQTSLGQLADQTGGFLISNTNDLGAGLRHIDEDMRVHYVLTYAPSNQEYDGKFRQISVKLNRSNLDVQTRKGYYAIEAVNTSPVLDYEVPALAALRIARQANPFALRLGGLSLPAPGRPGLTPVLVEVPLAALTFTPDKDKKTWSTDFSIVALIRDETKQVAQKLSQQYPLSGPLDKLESARKGEVLFYREPELAPGRYTIEAVIYDAPSGKASVQSLNVEVPDRDETKLRLSSLLLVKRADRLTTEERQKENPLHFGEVILYPNLGEPLHKATSKQLAFYFTAWPARGSNEKPRLTIEVQQNGRTIAQTPAELAAADESGQIRHVSALPLDSFQPGTYELKITVQDARSSVSRSTPFTIAP